VEINPLVLTTAGKLYAADCRMSIDDASVSRHPELGIGFPRESDRPPTELERIAWKVEEDDYRGVSFFAQLTPEIQESGYIGYHAIGGGGALLAADALGRHGLKLADYAETSGNPPASKVYRTAKIILSQCGIQGYCLMGAVMSSQDLWHHAHGLVKAFREELAGRPGFPVVILLCGNKEQESLSILREGLRDLPIRLELFGREHIHQLDAVAARMKSLVEEYHSSGKAGGHV
jgi:succinyl-CoA synthetase beta subunit